MPCIVRSTPTADRQIQGLRGPRRKAYQQFEQSLAHQGCAALGYRLTGQAPLSSLCVKHLRGRDRVVVCFVADQAWILLVGPHDEGDATADVYLALYELLGIEQPTQPRTKPPCCGTDPDQSPPTLDQALVDQLVLAAKTLRQPRTKGR
jgi:hypothetical protein